MWFLGQPVVWSEPNISQIEAWSLSIYAWYQEFELIFFFFFDLICPADTVAVADNATAGSLGRRRAGQLRFGFVAVSAGHIVYTYIHISESGLYSM
jgi:uncharacterized membrane protein